MRAWVDRALGSVVVSAATQQGGFSPGVAARLVTASGRRAFVKAVGTSLNPKTPSLFRQEIVAVQAIGPLPSAPALYDVYDDGDWVGLLFEDIEGRLPPHPWEQPDADRVLDAVSELTDGPGPVAVAGRAHRRRTECGVPESVGQRDRRRSRTYPPGWPAGRRSWRSWPGPGCVRSPRAKALAHWDLRADNIILTDDRVVFIDWAHPALAPHWADTVILQADMRESVDAARAAGRRRHHRVSGRSSQAACGGARLSRPHLAYRPSAHGSAGMRSSTWTGCGNGWPSLRTQRFWGMRVSGGVTNPMVSISGPPRSLTPDDAGAAVSDLYRQYWAGLVRLAVLVMEDRQAAEDVVQEAFAELYRHWPLRESGAALGYLRTTVLNRCRSVLRRRKAARLYIPPHEAPNPSAESFAVVGEDRLQVRQALRALSTRAREVLVLRYYLDLSFAEISQTLGISESTARSTSSRALANLTQKLEELR